MIKRCDWANHSPQEIYYHDNEWGIPVHDDNKLFEMLILESMQAGLSWSTILSKRETLKEAYDNFDYKIIATYDDNKYHELLNNPGIIRNKLKIKSVITNAHAFMEIQESFGSFDQYIWNFVDGTTINNSWNSIDEVPAKSDLSIQISQDLKKRGFKFLGPTTVYAFMQATGLVNDHMNYCFKKK
ncbi:DNA-3-methyladenine glycosylase I [Erysipelothrix urinaevulpis]|uniref:DNA-3-methyladenine glycosylase I n=1 Tax=Erysipelothrix urinaevulpis TaxID=2683717 RepID=UPI0019164105|nr:DNA-3-methyladenine glycosylase I [Erysipelothrix urinaevulpis]